MTIKNNIQPEKITLFMFAKTNRVITTKKNNIRHKMIILGDTQYTADRFYMEGVKAARQEIPWSCNPYRDGSMRHDQWNYGHENECAGEHEGLQI